MCCSPRCLAGERRAFLRQAPFTAYTSNTPTTAAALDAILDQVLVQGYAMVRDTVEYGAAAVAVPVRDGSGAVIAALNSSAGAVRERDVETILDRLDLMRCCCDPVGAGVGQVPGSGAVGVRVTQGREVHR